MSTIIKKNLITHLRSDNREGAVVAALAQRARGRRRQRSLRAGPDAAAHGRSRGLALRRRARGHADAGRRPRRVDPLGAPRRVPAARTADSVANVVQGWTTRQKEADIGYLYTYTGFRHEDLAQRTVKKLTINVPIFLHHLLTVI